MIVAYTYPLLNIFWTMLELFLLFVWIWLLISVFADIFRSHDLGGGAKALWVIFVIILPFLGVFVYLIARGGSMHERSAKQADQQRVGIRRLRPADCRHDPRRPACPARSAQGQGIHHRRRVPGGKGEDSRLRQLLARFHQR